MGLFWSWACLLGFSQLFRILLSISPKRHSSGIFCLISLYFRIDLSSLQLFFIILSHFMHQLVSHAARKVDLGQQGHSVGPLFLLTKRFVCTSPLPGGCLAFSFLLLPLIFVPGSLFIQFLHPRGGTELSHFPLSVSFPPEFPSCGTSGHLFCYPHAIFLFRSIVNHLVLAWVFFAVSVCSVI